MRSSLLALAAAAGLALLAAPPASAHPAGEAGCFGFVFLGQVCPGKLVPGDGDNKAAATPFGDTDAERLELVAELPKGELKGFNTDLAFWGKHAIAGNYDGFTIYDVSKRVPEVVGVERCPGSQNDVSVWGDLVITSTDSPRNVSGCDNGAAATQQSLLGNGWEGLRVFDWSDPSDPQLITAVQTKCGSHTHTLVPEPAKGRLLAYVSSYSPGANANCAPPHDLISIVEIPLDEPERAKVIAEPVLFPLVPGSGGGLPGGQPTTSGCHDITAYPEIGLAAGACMGEGIILDIKDPAAPKKLATITDLNFSFWHSATFSDDGTKVIFTDEQGGGTAAECTSADADNNGADAIYDISDPAAPKFLSYFKIPRDQTNQENCVSHNGSLLPHPTRDLFVQAWYQGGTSVIDFTDPKAPKEVAFFDRGPIDPATLVAGGHWSSYWYNGRIYGNEIHRGFDVLEYTGDTSKVRLDRLNAQTQERFRR
jgi:hypothetical protein